MCLEHCLSALFTAVVFAAFECKESRSREAQPTLHQKKYCTYTGQAVYHHSRTFIKRIIILALNGIFRSALFPPFITPALLPSLIA